MAFYIAKRARCDLQPDIDDTYDLQSDIDDTYNSAKDSTATSCTTHSSVDSGYGSSIYPIGVQSSATAPEFCTKFDWESFGQNDTSVCISQSKPHEPIPYTSADPRPLVLDPPVITSNLVTKPNSGPCSIPCTPMTAQDSSKLTSKAKTDTDTASSLNCDTHGELHHTSRRRSEIATTVRNPNEDIGEMSGHFKMAQTALSLADSPQYMFQDLSATPESATQLQARLNPLIRQLQHLQAQYEALEGDEDCDSTSDSGIDTDTDLNGTSDGGINESIDESRGTRSCSSPEHGRRVLDSDSPDSFESNPSSTRQSYQNNGQGTSSQISGSTRLNQNESCNPKDEHDGVARMQVVPREYRNPDHTEVLPCPLSSAIGCPGKDKDMATLE